MQPSSNNSLAQHMVPKGPSAYLCTSYSSNSNCLNDCHLLGAIEKPCTLVINYQSIRNKIYEIEVLLYSINHDVIIGTESWLNDDILSSQIIHSIYNAFRENREDSYGGVFIAV